jgi:hypothetical protein
MLRCFLNDALEVVGDERIRRELRRVVEVVDDLVSFLNEKHGFVNQLVEKCRSVWGDPK